MRNDYKEFTSVDLNKLLIGRLRIIENRYKGKKILIFIDSLDQLNRLDYDLNWFVKTYPANTKLIYSTLTNYHNIIEVLKAKGLDDDCFLHISKLDYKTSLQMYDNLMSKKERVLARNEQRDAVKALFQNKWTGLYPLYVKLIFDITENWCFFKTIEDDFGELLVTKCLSYLTLSGESGISDNELEAVLSIDEELLSHLFKKQNSPIKKFPITLWNRIKFYLHEYLSFKEVDKTQVYSWFVNRI